MLARLKLSRAARVCNWCLLRLKTVDVDICAVFRKKNCNYKKAMALWMETGSEPQTDSEKADLDAIVALKESTAFELKVLSFCLSIAVSVHMKIILQIVIGVRRKRVIGM